MFVTQKPVFFVVFAIFYFLYLLDGTLDCHEIFSIFSSGPIILKIHELSLIYSILLKVLFGISWPQQYESLFALGHM